MLKPRHLRLRPTEPIGDDHLSQTAGAPQLSESQRELRFQD